MFPTYMSVTNGFELILVGFDTILGGFEAILRRYGKETRGGSLSVVRLFG